ncbi:MAG: alpha/beta fold hydrolase [Lautropia sp.]
MRLRLRYPPLAGLLPLALGATLLAGCGSDDEDTAVSSQPPATAPTPAPAPGPVPTPTPAPTTATLLEATPIGGWTAAALDADVAASSAKGLTPASACDVAIERIRFRTRGPAGEETTASGALLLPSGAACPPLQRLVAYTPGTSLEKTSTLADPASFETRMLAALLAGQGYTVVATDYLGYGQSTFPRHPYLVADSEASTNLDAIRAAREVATLRGLPLATGVLLTGYSQGGHASMATQRLLERTAGSDVSIAAAGHMSGPYDLVGSVGSALDALPLGDIGSTYYIPFAVTSFQQVYGNLYGSPQAYFQAPFAATIENLLPGTASVAELIVERKLPLLLENLVTDTFVRDARDPSSALRQALALNSPLDFAPKAPTLLCGGARDPVVKFDNTRAAAAAFAARGATAAVTVVDVEEVPGFDDALPDARVPAEVLTSYHARDVPPLCLISVRDRLFAPLASTSTATR